MPQPTLSATPRHSATDRAARYGRTPSVDGMVARFALSEGMTLTRREVALKSGARVVVDGVDESGTTFVEAHASTGPLGHLDLVRLVQDVFKLALIRHDRPEARAVLLVGDAEARETLRARVARTPASDLVEIRVC